MLLQPGLAQIIGKRTAVALFPKRPPTCLITQKKNILGLTLDDLKTVLSITKWPVYRAYQIYSFLYRQRGTKWKDAENIPMDLRADLEDEWSIDMGKREKAIISEDGTSKLVFNFDPKCRVECNENTK
jgi:23S rRNA (adenine2503-C2)-methyltransferase